MPIRARNIGANILLCAVSTLMMLVVTELILRATVYNFKQYPVSTGPGSVYEINTVEFRTSVRINRLNVRGPEIPPKGPGERRVICLGDSFTFGLGVNESEAYPAVLDSLLSAKDPLFRSYNTGPGPYVRQDLDFMLKDGLDLKPDVVVLQIYIGNDFYDGLSAIKSEEESVKPAEAGNPRAWIQDLKASLKDKCVTLDFLWRNLSGLPYVDSWLFRLNLRYDNRGIFLKDYPVLETRLVQHQLEQIDKMQELLNSKDIRFLCLLVPAKQQVFLKDSFFKARYDYQKPNALLKRHFLTRGIDCIDLLEEYDSMPSETVRSFYYLQDQHWTAAGHRHAASAIARKLMTS